MVKGEVLYKNGDEYSGELGKNNVLEGNGTYKFKDGSIYTGHFKNSKFHGKGKLIDRFQDLVINAQFKEGKAEGWGRIIYGGTHKYDTSNNKNIEKTHIRGQYEGDIKNGERHGKGKYTFFASNESQVVPVSYEGLFEEDAFQGMGKLIFSDKSFYHGNFRQNLYNGHGEYQTSEFTYSGQFAKGVIQGKGIMKYQSGEYYEGTFTSGMKDGFGEYHYFGETSQQQYTYAGQWKNDQKQGKGKLIMRNGDIYQGQFMNDQPYGEFKCMISGVEIVAQVEGQILNGPIKFVCDDNEKKFKMSGCYKSGKKHGVFVMEKMNKYGQKVSYRGEFKEGKELPYSISYSHRF